MHCEARTNRDDSLDDRELVWTTTIFKSSLCNVPHFDVFQSWFLSYLVLPRRALTQSIPLHPAAPHGPTSSMDAVERPIPQHPTAHDTAAHASVAPFSEAPVQSRPAAARIVPRPGSGHIPPPMFQRARWRHTPMRRSKYLVRSHCLV